MKIKGNISMRIDRHSTTIEIRDDNACTTFLEISLTPEQLSEVLSRLAYVKCELEINDLHKIGKTMEHKSFSFEISGKDHGDHYMDRGKKLTEISQKLLDDEGEGFISDGYFTSQDSFKEIDDNSWMAKCTARRWV
jgi:hypothetical protein